MKPRISLHSQESFLQQADVPSGKCFLLCACDCWLRRGRGFLNCFLWTLEEVTVIALMFCPPLHDRVGGGRTKTASRKGFTSREKSVFDLKMKMLCKCSDRKDCLLHVHLTDPYNTAKALQVFLKGCKCHSQTPISDFHVLLHYRFFCANKGKGSVWKTSGPLKSLELSF